MSRIEVGRGEGGLTDILPGGKVRPGERMPGFADLRSRFNDRGAALANLGRAQWLRIQGVVAKTSRRGERTLFGAEHGLIDFVDRDSARRRTAA